MRMTMAGVLLCGLILTACDPGTSRFTGSASWSGEVTRTDDEWTVYLDGAVVSLVAVTITPTPPATDTATPTLAPTPSPTATATPGAGVVSKVAGSPYAAGFRIVGGSLAFGRGAAVQGAGYEHFDARQGTISLWLTPEWAGSAPGRHELLRWSAAGGIWKAADGRLYASFAPTVTLSVDVAGWQAGVRRRVEVRWDSAHPIDAAGNHAAISVDDTHTYGVTGAWAPESPAPMIYVGSDASGANHVAGQINGLVISRAVWWDGSAGTDTYWGEDSVGLTGSKTSGAPYGSLSAPRMGTWDVVAALPTNRVLGAATSGTVDGWSMPHASNLLPGGFAPADGATWALSGLAPGADYVIRAVGWSDGQGGVPRLTAWDGTAGTEIAHLDGSATSTRRRPDNLLYAFEVPPGCTSIEVRLSGGAAWGQAELYPNLVTNPSFERGAGDPWIPTGWTSYNALPGEVQQDAAGHTGAAVRIEAPATNHHGIIWRRDAPAVQYTYRAWGGWAKHPSTDARYCYHREQSDRLFRDATGTYAVQTIGGNIPGWQHHGAAVMRTTADITFSRDQIFNGAVGCVAGYFDDVYQLDLPGLALEVTQ